MITVLSSVQRTYTHIPITMPNALGRYASSPSALCFFSLPIALGRYANIYTIHILTSSTVFFLTQSYRPTGLPCTTLEVKQKKIAYYSTDYCNKRCSLYLVLCPWQVYPKIKAKKKRELSPSLSVLLFLRSRCARFMSHPQYVPIQHSRVVS